MSLKTSIEYGSLIKVVAAAILIPIGFTKFLGGEADLAIFSALGVGDIGRYAAGISEVFAGGLILFRRFSLYGSILGVLIMGGAFLSHWLVLGFTLERVMPEGDGGVHLILLSVTLLSCAGTTYLQLMRKGSHKN